MNLSDIDVETREKFYEALAEEIRISPFKPYQGIAAEFQTSIPMVIRVAKLYDLTRPRGRKSIQPKLTEEDKQQARMAKGCCPVHGIPLTDIGNYKHWHVTKCPRRDCPTPWLQETPNSPLVAAPDELKARRW